VQSFSGAEDISEGSGAGAIQTQIVVALWKI
jgi:hypothetical protein